MLSDFLSNSYLNLVYHTFYSTSVNKYILLGCPAVLEIILQNEAKEKHSTFEGTYLISDSLVNGHRYWNQEGKGNAIWYDLNNYWIVDDERWLGQSTGKLWNSDSTASCPNFGKWNYWDTNDWITPNNNDIIFLASGNHTLSGLKELVPFSGVST